MLFFEMERAHDLAEIRQHVKSMQKRADRLLALSAATFATMVALLVVELVR